MPQALAGGLAGLLVGFALQRGDVCFHSAFRGVYERRTERLKTWALGVAVAAVGLSVVFALGPWDGLSRGLAFRPVHNVVGGLVIGIGMVVARSCNSGLFYKLGSGMLGAVVGLAGLGAGEITADRIPMPGPTVLGFGDEATLPGVLGVPRLAVALPLAVAVVALLFTTGRGREVSPRRWAWPVAGIALGVAAIVSWVLAGAGGASFGASTVGAAAGIADGSPPWWLIAFLAGLVVGSALGAGTSGGWWFRGERPARYVQLLAGGFLLGGGARIAGGCNLGHGLSGMAQLNVSSIVVVASIVVGVGVARLVQVRLIRVDPRRTEVHTWTPALREREVR